MIKQLNYFFSFIIILTINNSFGQVNHSKDLPKKTLIVPIAKERPYTKWSAKAGANVLFFWPETQKIIITLQVHAVV